MVRTIPYDLLALGAVFTFAFLWAWDKTYRATLSKALLALAGVGFGGIKGVGEVHPLSFLRKWDDNIKRATADGMQASERKIVYAINRASEPLVLIVGTLVAAALGLWELGQYVVHVAPRIIHKTVHETVTKPITKVIRVTSAVTKAQFRALTHRVDAIAHRVAHLTHVIGADVAALPARVGVSARQLRRLTRRLSKVEKATVGAGAAALVLAALARLGLGWVKCESAKGFFRRRGCNAWNLLDDVLGLLADVVLLANICQVIPWLADGFEAVAAPVIENLGKAGAGLCNASYAPAPKAAPPTLYLPAADLSLHLPE